MRSTQTPCHSPPPPPTRYQQVWRILHTTPTHQNLPQHADSRTLLLIEMATLTSSILVYFFMSRTNNRSPTADRTLDHQTLTLQFHPDSWIHHILIRRFFTGAYH